MFSNEVYTVGNAKYCELQNCVISNAGECGTGNFDSPDIIYLNEEPSYHLMIKRDQAQGYVRQFCLTCDNGGEKAHIDGIRVQVCKALTEPIVLEKISLAYIEDADNDEREYNFNNVFGNDDPTNCQLTCEIL